MPAIPIFKDTPINASKASEATPQTEEPQSNAHSHNTPELSHSRVGAPAPALAPSSTHQQPYPPAQPGAALSLPVQTASAQAYPVPRPTPTQKTDDVSPPPPQPGAAPMPMAGTSTLPPPPKAGEAYHPPAPTPATQATPFYPPQMGIPPPAMSHSALRGSSTSIASGPQMTGPRPIPLGGDPTSSLEHPPGYQQDVGASEFSSHQRAAHHAAVTSSAERGFQTQSEEGVWDTAKKWAQAAGGSLAAAEQEVWKRINKD
ncbi:uncharacterized protein ColSpa_04082 [Colletotrichum spaethianum]|uniref:Uncharacterized protein n=1 Tax=Colletotrichum spaethianum TaxID=700344 RepID=A0AA37L8C3_9PEZI|nr:uncharacterized protein ColSpa_04082 [Colletotrichum spaethianum]GKT43901.1 hypothetical protein ColSpa_04082 [Colletotrichum spaethianum]